MKISEVSINRPVFATMMSLAIIIFGTVGIQRLPVRELPDIDPPIVNVTTVYPGANAQIVETEITERIEESVNGIEGIKRLTSSSREQVSNVTIEFDLSRNIDFAANEVRDRVARVRGGLPDEINEPIVSKQDADARPMMWIPIFSAQRTTVELTELAENRLKEPLQTLPGVSSIFLGGEKRFAIRIRLDPAKMTARQVTVLDLERALREQNVDLPSGRVENLQREMTIFTRGDLTTVEEFNRLVLAEDNLGLVRLSDIGYAEEGVENEQTIARYRGVPAVGLGIVKQSQANTIEVAKAVKARMAQLERNLPDDVEWFVGYDESIFIEDAIGEVWNTLGIAFALVVIVIFVFLRNIRSTIVPVLTIPVAIIGTFFFIYLFGFSINILTMLALVLVIGIVVDDSIIVLENIYRHIEAGMLPMEAAKLGMKEITFAVVSTTISLVAVFFPLALQTSDVGRLFIEFGLTLCIAVVVSSFVALTLTPMVVSRLVKKEGKGKKPFILLRFFEWVVDRLREAYCATLKVALAARWAVFLVAVAAVGGGVYFFNQLEREFQVEEDKGRMFSIAIAPEGATAEYTDRQVRQMEAILAATPEVDGYFSAVALPFGGAGRGNQGFAFVRFTDRAERDRSVQEIVMGPGGIRQQFLREVEGAFSIASLPQSIGRGFGQPFSVAIKGSDLEELEAVTRDVIGRLQATGTISNPRSGFELSKPELRVQIDRDRTAALDVSIADLSRTLQILFGGSDLSTIKQGGEEYEVIVQLDRQARLTPGDIDRLYVRNRSGDLVQLSNLVTTQQAAGPNAISRVNRSRASTIEGTPQGVPIGTLLAEAERVLDEALPEHMSYEFLGEAEDLQETGYEVWFVLGLAIILVYMVLASQFESLSHPLTVITTVPLAALGAFGSLWIFNTLTDLPGMSVNLFSQIGMILLVGLVTKNAILLVEFANQMRAKGLNARDAMLEAGMIRFRPILMTSLSTVAGLMPLIIGSGAGAESRRPLGVAAAGGLITSLALTLVVIPVVYTVLASLGDRLKGKPSDKQTKDETVQAAPETG